MDDALDNHKEAAGLSNSISEAEAAYEKKLGIAPNGGSTASSITGGTGGKNEKRNNKLI